MRHKDIKRAVEMDLSRDRASSLRPSASREDDSTLMTLRAYRRFFSRAGQQIAEYAVLIAAIAAALSAMYLYGKRGVQSVIRDQTTRMIGPQVASAPLSDSSTPMRSNSVGESISSGTTTTNTIGIEKTYVYDQSSFSNGTMQSISDTQLADQRQYVSGGSGGASGASGGGPVAW